MGAMKLYENLIENNTVMMFIFRADDGSLVFLNRKSREYTGLTDESGYVGKSVADVFPCMKSSEADECLRELKENDCMEWNYYNSLGEYRYKMKETLVVCDGTRCVVVSAEDKYDEWKRQSKRQYDAVIRARNESIVNEALKLALAEKTADDGINVLIRYVGEQMESDRFYIFEQNPDGTVSNTYEWCREGVVPEIDGLKNLPYEGYVELWYDEFRKNNYILIDDMEKYKKARRQIYDILAPQNIRTLVVAPILINGRISGFYGVDNPPRRSLKNIINLYQVLGHFISLLLRYRDNMKLLNEYSYVDQLSGLRNRHALDEFTDRIDPDSSLAYIFCDINGLKKVNDTEGHAAGDRMIRKTSEVLRSCFPEESVYRMGGDEFLVTIQGKSELETIRKMEELRKNFSEAGISVAMGEVWNKDGRVSGDMMLLEADKRMYVNKREIYGERRRIPWPPLSITEYREG